MSCATVIHCEPESVPTYTTEMPEGVLNDGACMFEHNHHNGLINTPCFHKKPRSKRRPREGHYTWNNHRLDLFYWGNTVAEDHNSTEHQSVQFAGSLVHLPRRGGSRYPRNMAVLNVKTRKRILLNTFTILCCELYSEIDMIHHARSQYQPYPNTFALFNCIWGHIQVVTVNDILEARVVVYVNVFCTLSHHSTSHHSNQYIPPMNRQGNLKEATGVPVIHRKRQNEILAACYSTVARVCECRELTGFKTAWENACACTLPPPPPHTHTTILIFELGLRSWPFFLLLLIVAFGAAISCISSQVILLTVRARVRCRGRRLISMTAIWPQQQDTSHMHGLLKGLHCYISKLLAFLFHFVGWNYSQLVVIPELLQFKSSS